MFYISSQIKHPCWILCDKYCSMNVVLVTSIKSHTYLTREKLFCFVVYSLCKDVGHEDEGFVI